MPHESALCVQLTVPDTAPPVTFPDSAHTSGACINETAPLTAAAPVKAHVSAACATAIVPLTLAAPVSAHTSAPCDTAIAPDTVTLLVSAHESPACVHAIVPVTLPPGITVGSRSRTSLLFASDGTE
jgi:hypothetical protein